MGLEGKRILVTGASGFIGSHLADELRRRGADVLTLDTRDEIPIDVRDWREVRDFANRSGKLEVVYHLAALMFVPYSFENPREIYEVNVLGTLNILELCRLYNVEKIVFSSSYTYGDPQHMPINEKHPVNPTSPYARSKVLAEALCKAYYEDYSLSCTILRSFNIYGEGQNDRFLIPSILKQMPSGKIELMDPEPKRDFLYVSDAVKAYIRAGEYSKSGFDIFNIGYGLSYSVDEIVSKVMKCWGKKVDVIYQVLRRRDEIMDVVADVRKAREQLDWEPEIDLDEGLSRYMKWYRANAH